ncbi:hypothetical protein [Saccharothrix xinjiangensis]|uniref:Uncharacterized protein n=1 Tax=Saccharothrix xinjiangensis TaxID=204798 RepID=A0ABV9XVT8_9PSEU
MTSEQAGAGDTEKSIKTMITALADAGTDHAAALAWELHRSLQRLDHGAPRRGTRGAEGPARQLESDSQAMRVGWQNTSGAPPAVGVPVEVDWVGTVFEARLLQAFRYHCTAWYLEINYFTGWTRKLIDLHQIKRWRYATSPAKEPR